MGRFGAFRWRLVNTNLRLFIHKYIISIIFISSIYCLIVLKKGGSQMEKWSVRTIKFPYLGVQIFFFLSLLFPNIIFIRYSHQDYNPRLHMTTTKHQPTTTISSRTGATRPNTNDEHQHWELQRQWLSKPLRYETYHQGHILVPEV